MLIACHPADARGEGAGSVVQGRQYWRWQHVGGFAQMRCFSDKCNACSLQYLPTAHAGGEREESMIERHRACYPPPRATCQRKLRDKTDRLRGQQRGGQRMPQTPTRDAQTQIFAPFPLTVWRKLGTTQTVSPTWRDRRSMMAGFARTSSRSETPKRRMICSAVSPDVTSNGWA